MQIRFLRFTKYFSRAEKGFTLIELLVVISILGVLAAVSMPNVISLMDAGNVAAANTELSTVQTAVDAHISQSNPVLTPVQMASIRVPTNAGVAAYIRGGDAAIKGEYKVDSSGTVLIDSVGTWKNVAISPISGRVYIKVTP